MVKYLEVKYHDVSTLLSNASARKKKGVHLCVCVCVTEKAKNQKKHNVNN